MSITSPAPDVAVVVPTRNSARTLERCLCSLRAQSVRGRIIVVDNHSTDATQAIAARLADTVVVRGPERSAQRNLGAALADATYVGFVDSDMVLPADVVAQATEALRTGLGAVIVPERTVGDGFWAAVRSFERSFYDGDDGVESARFFDRALFEAVGGFDETLDAAEDWDLTMRVRARAPIGRIAATIDHEEGRVVYRRACAKKASYAVGLRAFHRKHGATALAGALNRAYLRRPWRLLYPHPVLGLAVVALKAGEAGAVGWSLLLAARRPGSPEARRAP